MRRLGLILMIAGAAGLLFAAFSFVGDYRPMWIHAVKSLPDKDTFTHQEVAAAVIQHIERTRAHFYLGLLCSVLQIAGAACVWKGRMPNYRTATNPEDATVAIESPLARGR